MGAIAFLFVLVALVLWVCWAVGSRNDRGDEVEYTPTPSAPRPIYGKVDHYDVDVTTGTVSYHVVTTNADRIRSMTDEELTDFLLHICDWEWGEWLKEEVSE